MLNRITGSSLWKIDRPESRDISGNFKHTPSAKFETMISEPRPKQRKNG